MKKIGKITINPEKVIKNKELVNLKGSYGGGGSIQCYCKDAAGTTHYTGSIDDCSKEERWVTNMCWPEHQDYSYCDCPLIA